MRLLLDECVPKRLKRELLSLIGSRPIINTSFNMDVGETVVVGTSRLQGDTALIVLLTALSHSDRSSRGGR